MNYKYVNKGDDVDKMCSLYIIFLFSILMCTITVFLWIQYLMQL